MSKAADGMADASRSLVTADMTDDRQQPLVTPSTKKSVDEGTQTSSPTTTSEPSSSLNDIFQTFAKYFQQGSKNDKLGWMASVFIMVAMSYGSAVLILPYTIRQLGTVVWILYTSSCFIILAFCAVLLKETSVHVMMNTKNLSQLDMIRHPYPKIASIVVGKRFSAVVQGTMYLALICEVLAFMLLAATTLNELVHLYLLENNRIRVWLLICYIIAMPFFMIGTIKDLITPAFIAVSTSFIATVCILTITVVSHFYYGVAADVYETADTGARQHMFTIFGEILFAAAGPALLLPNIMAVVRKPENFHVPIVWSHAIVYLTYAVCAIIPYVVFGQRTEASIMKTLHAVVVKYDMSPMWLSVATIAEVALAIHFVMVSILSFNPVFLSLEGVFQLQPGFGWKRLLLRFTIALCLLIFSILIPFFEPVISLVGAIPLSLLCIIYPIILYGSTFDKTIYMNILLFGIMGLTLVLMLGNIVYNIIDIVAMFTPPNVFLHNE